MRRPRSQRRCRGPVLDADSISHRLIEPGQPAHDEILREFGPDLADTSGRIDRRKLAAIAFADPDKLTRLNAILHPRVEQAMLFQFDAWQCSGVRDAAFVEAALLIEAGFTKYLDGLVVAFCTPEQQLERLLARDMSEAEARRRIAAQLPIKEKLRHATYTIDCSGSLKIHSLPSRVPSRQTPQAIPPPRTCGAEEHCTPAGSSQSAYDGSTGAFLGTFVTAGEPGLNLPRDLVFGPDGNLYVGSFWIRRRFPLQRLDRRFHR